MTTETPTNADSTTLSWAAYVERVQTLSKGPRARLAWLVVHSFDDIREQRIEFDPRINVLLGKNGAGKTTLLEILARVITSDFSSWHQREFDVEYQYELNEWFWRYRVKNTRDPSRDVEGRAGYRPDMSVHAHFEEFDLRAESDGRKCRWSDGVRDETHETVASLRLAFLAIQSGDERGVYWNPRWSLSMIRTGNRNQLGRFDEGLDFFRTLVDGLSSENPFVMTIRESRPGAADIWCPQTLQWLLLFLGLDGSEMLSKPTQSVVFSAEKLKISQAVLDALGAKDVFADLGRPEIVRNGDASTITLSSLALWMERKNGDTVKHPNWSWGQRRLVAFALYLAANLDAVVADELVNGMHHEWIELCLRELGDRQLFVSSQNPILVDLVELHSIEQVRRAFVLCEVVPTETGRTTREWKNLDEKGAEKLFELRSSSLQSTSEIMRFQGWW